MFYKLIQHVMAFSLWSVADWGVALLALAVVAGLAYSLPSLLRLLVAPLMLLEAYFLTPSFACGGSLNMLDRVPGTQSACAPLEYSQYLAANMGVTHWYVLAGYVGLLAFLVWPVLKKMAYTNKETLQRNAEHEASASVAIDKMARIERIGKI